MTRTPDILKSILTRKAEEVEERKQILPMNAIQKQAVLCDETRGFINKISRKIDSGLPAIIAEIKKASPSKGIIRDDFDPGYLSQTYCDAGATCLSVLTDTDFFHGHDDHIKIAKNACDLPILRKDFIIDPYQVYESRIIGADCILIIVAALNDSLMRELVAIANELEMDVLVEVHNREELERAMMLRTPLIGINNRNLHTFDTSLNITLELLTDVYPDRIVVTESGINSKQDIAIMRKNNVNAFLIGEAFMIKESPGDTLREFIS